MNLIRNGGFERGNTDFWEMIQGSVFEVNSTVKKYGVYSGDVTVPSGDRGELQHSDYVKVTPGQALNLGVWLRTSAVMVIYITLDYYTADYSHIGDTGYELTTEADTWTQYKAQVLLNDEAEYARFRILTSIPAATEHLCVDSLVLTMLESQVAYINRMVLATVVDETASGDTSTDLKFLYGFNEYYAEIECTSLTGTTPTLDVEVAELDSHGHERILGTFTQISGVADQRVGIVKPIGTGMYVKYVEGGTWTDCDFKVSVIGVR